MFHVDFCVFVVYKNLIVPYFICAWNPPPVYSDPCRESHKAFYKRLFRVYSSGKNISLFIERSFCRRYGCGCLFSFFSVGRNFTFRINKTVNLLRFRTPFKTVLAFIRSVATYQYFCFQLIYFRSVFQTRVNVYFTFFFWQNKFRTNGRKTDGRTCRDRYGQYHDIPRLMERTCSALTSACLGTIRNARVWTWGMIDQTRRRWEPCTGRSLRSFIVKYRRYPWRVTFFSDDRPRRVLANVSTEKLSNPRTVWGRGWSAEKRLAKTCAVVNRISFRFLRGMGFAFEIENSVIEFSLFEIRKSEPSERFVTPFSPAMVTGLQVLGYTRLQAETLFYIYFCPASGSERRVFLSDDIDKSTGLRGVFSI